MSGYDAGVSARMFATSNYRICGVQAFVLGGRPVNLVNGCRGDAEFCGDRVDCVFGDVEVYPAVGSVVWTDVAIVVAANFIAGQPVEERSDVVDGQLVLFGDRASGA